MRFLLQLVTWWNGQTLGLRLFTWRKGKKVGEDEAGNSYFETRDGKRRWVIFADESEASSVTAAWHGWLHHTFSEPPQEDDEAARKSWEKPHLPNLTGTGAAYRPQGSLLSSTPKATGPAYEAWRPDH